MMTINQEVYRIAFQFVAEHGGIAPILAALEADRLLEEGNLGGAGPWRRVVKAIHEMTGTEGTEN